MNHRVKKYRDHCIYAILSFMKRFYTIIGLQMVNYKTLRFKVTSFGKMYCVILIGITFYSSAKYMEELIYSLKNDRLTLYYAFLEVLECSTAIIILFTESVYRTEEKSKVYANMRRIDKVLNVNPISVISTIALIYFISMIYEIMVYVNDFFVWEYNSMTVLALLKTLCIDFIVLQFVAEMHSSLARMKFLNDYMKNSLCDSDSVNAERCDFLTSWKLMPKEEKYEEKKDLNVLELARIYKELTDNIIIFIKRFKIPFSLLTAGTVCVVIIVIQIILLRGKGQDDSPGLDLSLFLWAQHYVLEITASISAIEALKAEINWTKEILSKTLLVDKHDAKIKKDLSSFAIFTTNRFINLTVKNCIPMDISLYYSLVSIVASYTIVFTQFNR